jgi:hypothetical protein
MTKELNGEDFKIGDICYYRFVNEYGNINSKCICIVFDILRDKNKNIDLKCSDLMSSYEESKDTDYTIRFPLETKRFRDFKILDNALNLIKGNYPEYFI